jgi:DNA-binding NarL/FixJ family response regulator
MSAMLHIVPPPNALENRRRIVVVDDHAFIRDLIARELTRNDGHYEVVAVVGTAADAVAVCRRLKPDLLVLDINLPDQTGVAAVPEIRRASPATRILLCTAYPKEDWFGEASSCGAEGFVEKTNTWDDFLVAVDRVSRGQRYFCADGKRDSNHTKEQSNSVRLTPREREILKLIAHGLTTKEIAAKLFISIPTVETHRSNLMSKTGGRNMADLVRFAIDAGLR